MHPVQTAPGNDSPGLAIGAGVAAGLVTLALVAVVLWLTGQAGGADTAGQSRETGQFVTSSTLETGDCVTPRFTTAATQYELQDCNGPHQAQITTVIDHPDADGAFPGATELNSWVEGRCSDAADDYLTVTLLETTLASRTGLPNNAAWADGDTAAVCSVEQLDGSSLVQSLDGQDVDVARGSIVTVARLLPGDCFVPAADAVAADLTSNSDVDLVSCDTPHNGVFFGRDRLAFAADEGFPGSDEVAALTSDRCAELFEDHFDADADGFRYRFWRPNQSSWDAGDRSILCSILTPEPLQEQFDPSAHQRFFDLAVGTCFNLGPEETTASLRLDDQVLVVTCEEPHRGQMIGSGELIADPEDPEPDDDGILSLAGDQCEQRFIDFVGISPFESDLGTFPFWFPNEPGWADGDRRYACAFLEETPLIGSLAAAES